MLREREEALSKVQANKHWRVTAKHTHTHIGVLLSSE
jgi:hypothetical protein